MLVDHLEKLVHFVGAVKAGSIRAYSIQNALSQPAISKSIQLLEEALEVNLMIRSREGVELTQPGQVLFEFSENTISQCKITETFIRSHGSLKLSGNFIMGAYLSIAVYFIPKFFKFIRDEQQELNMEIVSATSAELVKMVRTGKVDFVISVDPPKTKDLMSIKIYEDTYSLYRKVGSEEKLSTGSLYTVPLAKDSEGKSIKSYLAGAGITKNIFSCGDFETVKAMVEHDVGLGAMPSRVALPLVKAGIIEAVKEERLLNNFGTHSIEFSCRKHRGADKTMQWLVSQLTLMLRSPRF